MRLTVRDVMTTEVVTVPVDAPFKEVARLLDEHNVSALPVLDGDGNLVGVVSEGDLLPKEGYRDSRDRPVRLARLIHRRSLAKAEGDTVRELMTSPAVTIRPDATLAAAARTMADEGVKRLPVLDESGNLIGIASRADLVGAFLRTDEAIAEQIRDEIASRILLTEFGVVDVEVEEGVVVLSGRLDRKSSVALAENLAREVDGVVDVDSRLTYRWDDSKLAR